MNPSRPCLDRARDDAPSGGARALHSFGVRRIAEAAVFLVALACLPPAHAGTCPAPAPRPPRILPAPPPEARFLEPSSITRTVAHYFDAPLGIGFLEVMDGADRHYYDWMFELELPLWHAPEAVRPLGWLLHGRIHADVGLVQLTGAGMVETAYEHVSLIVWETRGEWVRIRLREGFDVWTHRCHLDAGPVDLDVVPWEAFLRRHRSWLHFRRPVPHILREQPGATSPRVTTIGLDHKLVLLDVRGDWMEVEVEQPDRTCSGADRDDLPRLRHRGWVKWRDARGPWVYVYTRGC